MTTRQIRLDDLLGRTVRDSSGRPIGRLFEIRGEERNGELLILEYHIGPSALLESIGFSLRRFAGRDTASHIRKVSWQQLDVSDPDHLVCRD